MLGSAAFEKIRWTSLQPNVFLHFALGPGVQLVKGFPKPGKQGQLATLSDEELPLGMWNRIRYPQSLQRICFLEIQASKENWWPTGLRTSTGRCLSALSRQSWARASSKFSDMSPADRMAEAASDAKSLILTLKHSQDTMQRGLATTATTSREVADTASL